MVKRFVSLGVALCILFSFLCIPVSAVVLSGTGQLYYQVSKSTSFPGSSDSKDIIYGDFSPYTFTSIFESTGPTSRRYVGLNAFTPALSGSIESNLVVSFSYYFDRGTAMTGAGSASALFVDLDGSTQTVPAELSRFEPGGTSDVSERGVTVVGTFEGSENSPVKNPRLSWSPAFSCVYANYTNKVVKVDLHVTSCRVISTSAPSADLAELKNIAKGIAESNQILSAMYGDILAVLNSIYERTGSILEAQNLTNQYFASIIPLLNNISSTTSNIYSLLSTQFSLLISTIESESDDIQSTINAAVDKMISYLDNVFSSSVNPALPGQSSDISSGSSTVDDAESGYQSTASERFEAISADFSGFTGDVLSGAALASTLFGRLWNVLGPYNIVYTVPLVVAICLTILGRADRRGRKDDGSASSDGRNTPDGLGGIPRLPGK